MIVPQGGGGGAHFDLPTNSKTKDAMTTKVCTVIVCHISTKNQKLDFPTFHCSVAIVLFGV